MCQKSDTLLIFEFPVLVKLHNVMVSIGVSRVGKTGVIFIEMGAKVSSSYYCERVLGEGLFAWYQSLSVVSTDELSSSMVHHRTLRKTRLGCTAAGWTQ